MPRCSRSRIAILTPTPEFGVVIKIPDTGARCDLGKRGCSEQPRTDRVPKPNQNRIRTKKNPEGRRRQPRPRKNHVPSRRCRGRHYRHVLWVIVSRGAHPSHKKGLISSSHVFFRTSFAVDRSHARSKCEPLRRSCRTWIAVLSNL